MKKIFILALLSFFSISVALASEVGAFPVCYDKKKSMKSVLISCETDAGKGDVRAQYFLGSAYYKHDHKQAFKWLIKAAEQGDMEAQVFVGTMFDSGNGVTQDYKQAIKWYTKSAEQGGVDAQYFLGVKLIIGRGVTQDYKQAFKWFIKAAEQGSVKAQVYLGAMYAEGTGITQDDIMAHMFWNVAAADGAENAKKGRDTIAKAMSPSQIEQAQKLAREWMEYHN